VPSIPDGKLEETIVKGPAGLTIRVSNSVAAFGIGVAESVISAVKENVPAELGSPESSPLESSVTPSGRDPETKNQVYGPAPPLALRTVSYA
jgi:hypothetical protein